MCVCVCVCVCVCQSVMMNRKSSLTGTDSLRCTSTYLVYILYYDSYCECMKLCMCESVCIHSMYICMCMYTSIHMLMCAYYTCMSI